MKQLTIQEVYDGNTVIGQFAGTMDSHGFCTSPTAYYIKYKPQYGDYHKDWNWILHAVQATEQMVGYRKLKDVANYHKYKGQLIDAIFEKDIVKTFTILVEYCKWIKNHKSAISL